MAAATPNSGSSPRMLTTRLPANPTASPTAIQLSSTAKNMAMLLTGRPRRRGRAAGIDLARAPATGAAAVGRFGPGTRRGDGVGGA
ncbi:MAG: hypothetical protein AVDCRST_MAG88-1951 [uncultured Thermomicrobiales bacterium]|uniref:Uncharacterized protein n=1 Tax=uncultured Thermomicrobiales bacterium TaxID=1645740 RepID=A0A6J4V2H8_9BACT|nr:MAG: hypothetical protein AVDCRST_MAG88-1951 [uncultured Thermomicrobiales bacterium]